jgi:hypothetical protein
MEKYKNDIVQFLITFGDNGYRKIPVQILFEY